MTTIIRHTKGQFSGRIGQDRAVNLYRSVSPFVPGGGGVLPNIDMEMDISQLFHVDDYPLGEISTVKAITDNNGLAIEREPLISFNIDPNEEFLNGRKVGVSHGHFLVLLTNGLGNSSYSHNVFRICKFNLSGELVGTFDGEITDPELRSIGQDGGGLQTDIHGNIYITVWRGFDHSLLVYQYSPSFELQTIHDTQSFGGNSFNINPQDNNFSYSQTRSDSPSSFMGYTGSDGNFNKGRTDLGFSEPVSSIIIGDHVFISCWDHLLKVSKGGEVISFIETDSNHGYWLNRTLDNNIVTSQNRIYSTDDLSLISSSIGGQNNRRIRKIGNQIFSTDTAGGSGVIRVDNQVVGIFDRNELNLGLSLQSAGISILNHPPLPPPNNFFISVDGGDLTLVWGSVEPAISYDIWIDKIKIPGSPVIPEEDGLNRIYTVEGILPGDHEVIIASVSEFGTGIPTPPKEFSIDLESPINISSGVDDNGVATITWDAVRDAEGYNLFINGEKINPSLISDPLYTMGGLANGEYECYVVAVYQELTSAPSDTITFTINVAGGKPPAPKNFSAEIIEIDIVAPENFSAELIDSADLIPQNFRAELLVGDPPENFTAELMDSADLIPKNFDAGIVDLVPKNFTAETVDLSPTNFSAETIDLAPIGFTAETVDNELIPQNFTAEITN